MNFEKIAGSELGQSFPRKSAARAAPGRDARGYSVIWRANFRANSHVFAARAEWQKACAARRSRVVGRTAPCRPERNEEVPSLERTAMGKTTHVRSCPSLAASPVAKGRSAVARRPPHSGPARAKKSAIFPLRSPSRALCQRSEVQRRGQRSGNGIGLCPQRSAPVRCGIPGDLR
jgi:hypothetical protein